VITRSRIVAIAALAVVATVVLVPQAASRTAPNATTAASATTVNVTAGKPQELRFTLSKKSVAKGKVTFKVKNSGQLPHDFRIAGKKTRLIMPGQTVNLVVTLKKGKRPYLCTVSGHAAGGMKGTLTVK
jgi:uncharacterized cupredoxin-like copper-binding protein